MKIGLDWGGTKLEAIASNFVPPQSRPIFILFTQFKINTIPLYITC